MFKLLLAVLYLFFASAPAYAQDAYQSIQNSIGGLVDDAINETLQDLKSGSLSGNKNPKALNLLNTKIRSQSFAGQDLHLSSLSNVDFTDGIMMYGLDLARAKMVNVDYNGADFNTPPGASLQKRTTTRTAETQAPVQRTITPEATAAQVSSQKIVETLTTTAPDKTYHKTPNINLAIQFEYDSDQLKGSAWGQLDELARALKSPALANSQFMIEGHTDDQGADDYNLDLSYRRALSVSRALSERFGISSERLMIKGYGETRPIADNRSDGGRALNRRVTIVKLEG